MVKITAGLFLLKKKHPAEQKSSYGRINNTVFFYHPLGLLKNEKNHSRVAKLLRKTLSTKK